MEDFAVGDSVEWGSKGMHGEIREIREHMPARKAGSRLGSWTNKFYKTRALVRFQHHYDGHFSAAWMPVTRLRRVQC